MFSDYEYTEYGDPRDRGPDRGVVWRVLGWVSVGLAVVLVGASLVAYGTYRKLQGNITQEDVTAQLGAHRPPKLNQALNVLLIGSDQRNGANAKYGRAEGERSDTIILLHFSPGGKKAVGISFPRDSMVQLPSCTTTTGRTIPGGLNMINASFNNGGAGCTMHTIETLTGIRVDHFVKVDFTGFKRVVDALGGVEVCLSKAVDDKDSKLHLSAGRHVIKGDTALAWVRNRHGLGDGSDLDRIKRQQKFLGAVVKKATSNGTLTNPGKLYGFLDAATKSVTTDKNFTVDEMKKVAGSLQGMSAGKVQFVTVPWGAYAPDPNRVAWRQPDANNLFRAIKEDSKIQAPTTAAKVTVPPAQVKVRVLNGTDISGLAQRVSDQLTARGYSVLGIGTAPTQPAQTEILYGAGADQAAAALGQVAPAAKPAPSPSAASGVVELILGGDWEGLKSSQPASIPKNVDAVNAADDACKDA